jgi:ribonuclease P protein component
LSIISLKNQKQFDVINKIGKKLHSDYFFALVSSVKPKFLPHDFSNFPSMFLGMKVGKKLGNAVIRNKIKRRIRHLSRVIHAKQTNSYISIILIPKKNFENILFEKLEKDFEKILKLTNL